MWKFTLKNARRRKRIRDEIDGNGYKSITNKGWSLFIVDKNKTNLKRWKFLFLFVFFKIFFFLYCFFIDFFCWFLFIWLFFNLSYLNKYLVNDFLLIIINFIFWFWAYLVSQIFKKYLINDFLFTISLIKINNS